MSRLRWNPYLRFPRSALALTVGLCLPLVLQLKNFEIHSELEVLLRGDQRNLESYQSVREILEDTEMVVVNLEFPEIFSPPGLDAIRRVSDLIGQLPGVVDVKSLTHSVKPVRDGLSFQMVPLVPPQPWTPAVLAELRAFCLTHPLIRNIMVAEDAQNTIILITVQGDAFKQTRQDSLVEKLQDTLRVLRGEGLSLQVLALPLVEQEIKRTLGQDIKVMLPAAFMLLVAILWITFRSWFCLGLILFSQGVFVLLMPGLYHLTGFSITVYSVMLLPLLAGIHLTLLAHVFTSFQRAFADTADPDMALSQMLREIFRSCCFATLTTMAGLASLGISKIPQIREFGIMGILGLAMMFIMTFGPGLALLKWLSAMCRLVPSPPSTSAPKKEKAQTIPTSASSLPPEDNLWIRLVSSLIRHRLRILPGLGMVFALAGICGWSQLRTDIRAVEFLNPQSPTRQSLQMLDRIYGGINVLQIELDTGLNQGVNDGGFLQFLDQLHRETEKQPGITGVYSYAQLMSMMHQIWQGGGPEELRLPDNALLRNIFVIALQSRQFPFLTALTDLDFRTAYLVLRTPDMPADDYLELIHRILDRARELKPDHVTITAARGLHSIMEADRQIVNSQTSSAGGAALLIGVLLMLLWRSPRLALIALLVNAIPVGLVMAMAGLWGIPLNSITVMVAAMGLGIAVDDSVHFLTHWQRGMNRGLGFRQVLLDTFRVKARPITATTAMLLAVFGLFALSSFPPVTHFGALCTVAFAGAWLSVWLLLPILLPGNEESRHKKVQKESPPMN